MKAAFHVGMSISIQSFMYCFSVQLLHNLPTEKLAKIADVLEVVSFYLVLPIC